MIEEEGQNGKLVVKVDTGRMLPYFGETLDILLSRGNSRAVHIFPRMTVVGSLASTACSRRNEDPEGPKTAGGEGGRRRGNRADYSTRVSEETPLRQCLCRRQVKFKPSGFRFVN